MTPYYTYNGTGYRVMMDTGTTNCAACNDASQTSSYYGSSNAQNQCSACKAGSQLFDYHGGYQCQQTCDPATEYRRYSSSVSCSKKLTSGSSCSTSNTYNSGSNTYTYDASGGCQSGVCGGPQYGYYSGSGSQYGGFCCSEAAAANCTTGCDSVSGACTTKSGAGESCKNTTDCYAGSYYGGAACLNGVCCAFSVGWCKLDR